MTGNSVVDMINVGDMEWINPKIGRKAFIWLNYPVTDYCINHLLMGAGSQAMTPKPLRWSADSLPIQWNMPRPQS